MNKLLAGIPALVLMVPMSVASCDPSETKTDHNVVCRQPDGYTKAGMAAKAGKGTFYGCIKNSKACVIKYGVSNGKYKVIILYRSGLFTVPKYAKGWNTSNCGKIYKKRHSDEIQKLPS